MTETAAPLSTEQRAGLRYRRLIALHAQQALLGLQIRVETAALVTEDTPAALASYVADELAMALHESPGTCSRWIDDALVTVAYPRLLNHAADQLAAVLAAGTDGRPALPELTAATTSGVFGPRHVDAVLDELAGAPTDTVEAVLDLVLTDPSVRTPHQLRRATRAARLLHDLDADRDQQDKIHDRRSVTVVEDHDGSASLYINGLKTKAAEMLTALDAQTGVGTPTPGETRTLAQRRYDYLHALLSGHVQATAPWQALIVVSLDTLEGGDTPAEIPGLGLVSAAEAREVLAQADLRRAVVDSDGLLLGLDDTLHTGDQTPLGPTQPPPPTPTDAPTDAPTDEQTDEDARELVPAGRGSLLTYCQDGITRLEELLHSVGGGHDIVWTDDPHDPDDPDDCDGPESGPDGPGSGPDGPDWPGPVRPGGDGRGTTTQPPTPSGAHAPHDPTLSGPALPGPDRPARWAPTHRAMQLRQQRLDRQARASRWTTPALHTAVTAMRTNPPTPAPAASTARLFRGRLAAWIRHRDTTCTFPGCPKLAQHCQLDHVVEHPHGPTAAHNGALECVHHHQCKHHAMTVTRLPDGTMRWTNRHGVTTDRTPRPLLRSW